MKKPQIDKTDEFSKEKINVEMFSNTKEANDKLDAIIENSFDGIYITDGQANTIKVNRSYENITGLRKREVLGHSMHELVKHNVISVSGSLMAIKERRVITLQQEFKTGRKALITSSPVYDNKGKIIMVVTNVRDLTELYNLKEEVQKKTQEEIKLRQELEHVREKLMDDNMVVHDKRSLAALLLADKVAPLDATVMLLGETGVGKEVFAKYIFQNSRRKDKSFIKINCGAIPANLIESELFGYEKGAFTGANKNGKMGLFEVADKGTIFLDEIGELPMSMQVKLLRVLQEQEIERIGGSQPIKIDVRIIAATNRNLEKMVKEKSFREDLYYRLMVFPINIPPLRERTGDIVPLSELFISNLNKKYGFSKRFSMEAEQILKNYNWPGNIRELKNIIERAIIISNGDEITIDSIPIQNKRCRGEIKTHVINPNKDLKSALEALELEYINNAYETYGNVRQAAESLGMNASTFVRKRQKYSEHLEQINGTME
ncbi:MULTISPECIES: sigma-54 interaction domain-containing protein [Clostridium]|uniref:HTH-type transcriptional regulatory protein TyrR n=1 Tax=Clostridium cadaveris TaxID=1529 RepID=A0A1I2N1Z9_9CLOT|nr:sigma 54-interacting transcriptional regulator [Clostridium cadaveris]MDU4952266.1 sigma 54-interacting transcriptional regulator [Clostridium sp.]MDM8312973.1 sigma 54-interacting transcriptional regulator [Clostridium cadaveris]NME65352.1 sigma 54-interacting transcriptional regulator [Clostridium cadaveris]NWK11200.1 sigma 54-interacting transcriptional regulator [Clostridium cadaveris]PWL55531.1 MAG: PAS domain S-box protein [Clostridium cadaveris]